MRIILLKDVAKVGKAGECVEVSDGYARNFMIPRQLAVEATPSNLRILEQKKAAGVGKMTRAEREAQALAEKLESVSLVLSCPVGKGDKLFGSVTSKVISDELAKLGLEVEKRKILLEEPIKTIGTFVVPIKLHPEVTAHLRVEVTRG